MKVVHIDNSKFFRNLFRVYLYDKGIRVESFASGEQAMEILQDGDVGLIIMGMVLTDMDGEDLIKRVTTSPYNIPVIILTSDTLEPEEDVLLEKLGVIAHFSKSGPWREQLIPYLDRYFPT
ncbi:MAG: response regulator [Treponema sp.]|jgi:DNA-binding response OmpR family regulator|nr:response regulator [Treponema sp.]